jgi:RNA polymerase sigma-70 factor (ECF subfamily)
MSSKDKVCDERVFSEIYQEHSRSVWNFIYFKTGDEEEANDLVQEAFIKLWNHCESVPKEKARSFLYTVINNAFLNKVAHKKVVLKYRIQQPRSVNKESPHFLLEEKEYMDKLTRAIDNLSEGQRITFLMNRVEGKKYREISEILQISVKAVEKRMSLALMALRKEIEEL